MKITVAGFLGENRSIQASLLPETLGTVSRNQKPGRGDLRPWKAPLGVAQVPLSRSSIYRFGRDVQNDSTYWMSWNGDVHVVRGMSADDTSERSFYTGDGAPKVTDNVMGIASAPYPTAHRPMGLPAPLTAPQLAAGAPGSPAGDMGTYFYAYTYVNDWGWESAPSPVSAAIDRTTNTPVTVSSFAAAPAGNYGIDRIRVYRTQAGSSGSSDFYFCKEIAIAAGSAVDNNAALGEVLETRDWLPAPGVPQGGATNYTEPVLSRLTPLWNGMLAGIAGNSIRFCESYVPYAWPVAYDVIPPDGKPVGLGVFGQNILVLTTSRPVVIAGSSPDSMDTQPVEMPQGCVAEKSIVSMGSGVAWASNDGLCWYGQGGARILTAGVMTREDWQALVPSSITGRMYEGLYFGSYSTDGGATRKGFFLDPSSTAGGIYFLDKGYAVTHFDELQDQLYVYDPAILSGSNVLRWDAGSAMTAIYKSKSFRVPTPVNFSCAQVVSDAYPVQVKFYADGALVHTRTATNSSAFRLPSGFKAQYWQIEVSTAGAVQAVMMATGMQDLTNG